MDVIKLEFSIYFKAKKIFIVKIYFPQFLGLFGSCASDAEENFNEFVLV